MKKLFLVFTISALVFMGCDLINPDKGNEDVIGTWIDRGEKFLEIGNGTFTFFNGYSYTGTWIRQGSVLTLNGKNFTGNATLIAEGEMRFYASCNAIDDMWTETLDLIKKGSGASFVITQLTIRNESSTTLYELKCLGQDFSWSGTDYWLAPSSSSFTQDVVEDSGYLYFTLRQGDNYGSQIKCRTQESISVSKGEKKTFTVTNNTLVVDLSDKTNTPKRLQEIASTLVEQ